MPIVKTENVIAAGQIWQEVDPRFERFIRVIECHPTGAACRSETVEKKAGAWIRKDGTRDGAPMRNRFHGRNGGYRYVEG